MLVSSIFMIIGAYTRAGIPVLQWDPNSEPNLLGYRVYCGPASGVYTRVTDLGLQTSLPLTNLMAGVTHYFAITAYDIDQIESPPSEEIQYTPSVDGTTSGLVPFRLSVAGGLKTLQFSGRAGQNCYIVASTDLQSWQLIYSATFISGGAVIFTDGAASAYDMRFYRVISTPP